MIKYTSDLINILAILGALAWLPHVIIWLRNWLVKPSIEIISDNEIEIGYTTYGPILNIHLAFLSRRKKSLIKNIELELTHEDHGQQTFSWVWFEEILYETDVPKAGIFPTRKNQRAIAINLNKDELIEKKIGFQQHNFKEEHERLLQKTTQEYLNLYNAGRDINELESKNSYNQLLSHYKDYFNWRSGEYHAKFIITLSENNLKFEHSFKFDLISSNIESLENNIQIAKSIAEYSFISKDKEVNENWAWIIRKKKT